MTICSRTAPSRLRKSWLAGWLALASLGQSCFAEAPGRLTSDALPATPLIACDPYFSVWSTGKTLTEVDTTHWTGKPHRLTCLALIDGKPYRLMGREPSDVSALPQVGSQITLTQTRYKFAGEGLELSLAFTTPALPFDIDVLSRPITYVTAEAKATDGRKHEVRLYWEASSELCVNTPNQSVVASRSNGNGVAALKVGSVDQPVLESQGDDLRIDWGYLYLAAPAKESTSLALGKPAALRRSFSQGSPLPARDAEESSRADELSLAIAFDLGQVGQDGATAWLVAAYDDLFSIEFMGTPLKPYWRRNGLDAEGLLAEAVRDRDKLLAACDAFDRELGADLLAAGGSDFAAIATAAYRQCFAAGKFVADANGQPIQFCKENHSNGCIGTSDVFYPMAPQFLLFGPSLAKSFVVPFMEYAASDRWKFPFAPHDLGTYPKANGQVYGGGERSEENQMPVEESGNLLILMAAIAQIDGNADFAERYWPQLTQWAQYLRKEGFDPANQLCTDDFAGHMAHNVNLSAKAICGLGSYALLCEMRGDDQRAAEYRAVAEEFAKRWVSEASDGDQYRLAFDRAGTWSQKYNLAWDRILGLNLFSDEVLAKEVAHYLRVQNKYGLPLDNRKSYTKLDWILWTATLAENRADFEALVRPVAVFLRETPDRSPMTDWYDTISGKKVGFTARPVVGGVFMQLLRDQANWQKWAERDVTRADDYAPLPRMPKTESRVASADTKSVPWRYATTRPGDDWQSEDFDDSSWQVGRSGFGTPGTPGARIGTIWDSSEIWLRRTFDLAEPIDDTLRLHVHHDEDVEIYVNGVLAARRNGHVNDYQHYRIRPEALQALRPRDNVLAVHCRQSTGGQYVDVGFCSIVNE